MKTLSERLAAFVAGLHYDDLPPEVVERVRLHTLDIIGVCLLGARMEFAQILRATLSQYGGAPDSTLIGSGGLKLPVAFATLFNAGLAHGNEFDDTYAPGRWHGSAITVPPALAMAEVLHADGRAFITAVAGALEVGCRLTRAAPALLYQGFHSTCTAGIFTATLAAGKLMGLDPQHLVNAMGVSGSIVGGTMEYLSDPESWSKRVQVGYAAHGAIIAAQLASGGYRGPRTILDGLYGYFRAYAREGNFDLKDVATALGSDWQVLRLYPKRYPCDHIAQGYIDCAIALGRTHGVTPERIKKVECVVHPLVVPVMFQPRDLRYRPPNGWSARWSMPFVVATALLDRALGIDSFAEARVHDPTTLALMDKVAYSEDLSLAFPDDYPAWVRICTSDGRVLEHKVLKVAGSAENPVSTEEYEAKFLANATQALDSGRANQVVDHMRELPALTDLAEVTALYA